MKVSLAEVNLVSVNRSGTRIEARRLSALVLAEVDSDQEQETMFWRKRNANVISPQFS